MICSPPKLTDEETEPYGAGQIEGFNYLGADVLSSDFLDGIRPARDLTAWQIAGRLLVFSQLHIHTGIIGPYGGDGAGRAGTIELYSSFCEAV